MSRIAIQREGVMKKAKVTFYKCIQDSQEYGSNDEYMISRIFFDIEMGDQTHPNLYVDIKQTVGGNFESSSLEVSAPHGYKGPFNYNAFRNATENYYRSLVGSHGTGIHIGGSASNIRMYNNTFIRKESVEFEVEGVDSGW